MKRPLSPLLCFVAASIFSASSLAQIKIENGSVRLLPPGVPNTSGYFTVHNDSNETRHIVSAQSDIVRGVELHNIVIKNDMMHMEQQEKITLTPGQTMDFTPGGYHLMMLGLKQPLSKGQVVAITLTMQNGEIISFNANVAEPGESHNHHHH